MIGILLTGFIFSCAIYWLFIKKSPIAHIPGPKPLPLIGNVHLLNERQPFLSLDTIAKTYGGVYSFQLFNEPTIVVTDPDCVYKLLVEKSKSFAGRLTKFRYNLYSKNQSSIVFTDPGPELNGRRKLTHSYIKQYGTGMDKIEHVTTHVLEGIVGDLIELKGAPYDPKDMVRDLTLNIMLEFLTGKADMDKDQMKLIEQSIYDLSKGIDMYPFGVLVDEIPVMRFIPNLTMRNFVAGKVALEKIISSWMRDDAITGFVNHMKELTAEDKQRYHVSKLEERICTTIDLLGAGTATTSATVYVLLNVLSQMPKVQDKLREELLKVVGTSRAPTLADRTSMPYLRAVILEIGRFASILPLGLPRKTTEDTSLNDFFIPKGVQVICNFWSMHHNEAVFEDPFTFNPERYLDAAPEVISADHPNRKFTMPFGAGARVCVGEQLALGRLFLIISTLVQKFTIEPESTLEAQPSMDPRNMEWGNVLLPPPYKVRFVPRALD